MINQFSTRIMYVHCKSDIFCVLPSSAFCVFFNTGKLVINYLNKSFFFCLLKVSVIFSNTFYGKKLLFENLFYPNQVSNHFRIRACFCAGFIVSSLNVLKSPSILSLEKHQRCCKTGVAKNTCKQYAHVTSVIIDNNRHAFRVKFRVSWCFSQCFTVNYHYHRVYSLLLRVCMCFQRILSDHRSRSIIHITYLLFYTRTRRWFSLLCSAVQFKIF